MRLETRERLRRLSDAAGKDYGKLVQKLLAVAFLEAGAERAVERSIQGVDLEVTLDGCDYALEVKTTESGTVRFGKKDLDGLEARREEGHVPYVAVLGQRLLDEWILARLHQGELRPGEDLSPTRLRPYRDGELEQRVSAPFDNALAAHVADATRGGQTYLNEVLKGYEAFRIP